ncbi:MAG TPA: hypothetical protein VFV63_04795 [Ilumatobacteraceae bacterium]|nr:hypothetical protein [Ilumatobacteraceae bacterium]
MVTGVATDLDWLRHPRLTVVRVPALIKDATGAYCNPHLSFEEALTARRDILEGLVRSFQPHAFVIDRHPYGVAGELRAAVELAHSAGTAVILGLRDILDEPDVIATELAGDGWADVGDLFDEVLVYGGRDVCDHVMEYGLPIEPTYCGWVTERTRVTRRDPRLVVVTGGGGADAEHLYRLVIDTAQLLNARRVAAGHARRFLVVAGPYASSFDARVRRLRIVRSVKGCAALYARSGAVVQMAGYNSAFESLGAGVRPILLPRRAPRREQAIRASRLTALGLADMIDDASTAGELAWLLGQDRRLDHTALAAAGISLDGAATAAHAIATHSSVRARS